MTDTLFDRLLTLTDRLRRAGIEISTGELIDATTALTHLDLGDRPTLKVALRATLVKSPIECAQFDRLFDLTFRATSPPRAEPAPALDPPSAGPPLAPALLAGSILEALTSGDGERLRLLAAQAVDLVAGMGGRPGGEAYLLNRLLRAIDLSRMLSAALQQARRDGGLTELELALHRSELSAMLEEFRRQLAAEIASRLARHADVDRAEAFTDPAERDILTLAGSQLAELRRAVQPLARQLAARIGRRRRARSTGVVDQRRTIRRSLAAGGVPIEVVHRRRHPHRPEIVLLCDVSGSVVEFAQFTFTLVNAIHDELSRVRSFAFIDGIGEVTDLFANATFGIPVARFVERKGVLGPDGHSDYGRVFGEFTVKYLRDAITPRTTVIVTGDARSNYRPANTPAFRQLATAAHRVYWLNPEAQPRWNTDDSIVAEYQPWCDGIFEVRTLRQLTDVIADLA